MNINDQFGSNKFLKSADLQGNVARVKIQSVAVEKLGDDRKMVMYFAGKEKGMVLNKTNAMTIGDAYGEDTDDWTGREIEVFSMKVEFQGKMVDGLRVRVARRPKPAKRDYDDGFAPPDDRDRVDHEDPAPRTGKAAAYAEASGRGAPRGGSTIEELDDEIPF